MRSKSGQSLWIVQDMARKIEPEDLGGTIISVVTLRGHVYWALDTGVVKSISLDEIKEASSSADLVPKMISCEIPKVVQITCGNDFLAYLTSDGQIGVGGSPFGDKVEIDYNTKNIPKPAYIYGWDDIILALSVDGELCVITKSQTKVADFPAECKYYIDVTVFMDTIIALGSNGRIYSLTFDADTVTLGSPALVFLGDNNFYCTAQASCNDTLFFLGPCNSMITYGYNRCGCLGLGNDDPAETVRLVTYPNDELFFEIAASRETTFMLTHHGMVYYAGRNPCKDECSHIPSGFAPLMGKFITHVYGSNGVFVAVEGGPMNFRNTANPPGSYKRFPIVVDRSVSHVSVSGRFMQVECYPEEYQDFWYHPGDIVLFEGSKAKVIGLQAGTNKPVVAMKKTKRVVAIEYDVPINSHTDLLFQREGADLVQIKCNEVGRLFIDKKHIHGFDYGESIIVEIDGDKLCEGTVIGARGPYVWIEESNTKQVVWYDKACVKPLDMINVFETVNGKNVYIKDPICALVMNGDHGLCEAVLSGTRVAILKPVGSHTILSVDDDHSRIIRYKGDTSAEIVCCDEECNEIVIKNTACLDFSIFDRVKTPLGYGAFMGESSHSMFAVVLDKHYFTDGVCTEFKREEVELIGKMSRETFAKEYKTSNGKKTLGISSSDFKNAKVMICDRVCLDAIYAFICGIDRTTDEVYARLDGSGEIVPVVDCEIIMRYTMIPKRCVKSSHNASIAIWDYEGKWIKPGDRLRYQGRELRVCFVSNSKIYVFDEDGCFCNEHIPVEDPGIDIISDIIV